MRCKYCALLSLAVVVLFAVAPMQADGDATDPPVGFYASQLDDAGRSVYDQVVTKLGSAGPVDSVTVDVDLGDGVLFHDADDAVARSAAVSYAEGTLSKVLTAIYLDDPAAIWLWNLPVSTPSVSVVPTAVSSGLSGSVYSPGSATVTLAVPTAYEGKVQQTLDEMAEAASEYKASSTVQKTIRSVYSGLSEVKVVDDAEGEVSNAHKALVLGESSSVGVAAAFTYLCDKLSIDSVTVVGTAFDDSEEGHAAAWNVVSADGVRYLCDATLDGCILVGYASSVDGTMSSDRIADSTVFNLQWMDAPDVNREAYEFPDERGFLEKNGTYIIMGLIVALLVGCVLLAVRQGTA